MIGHWAGHLLWIAFGPGTWGAGGNMLAWVICGALGFGWLHAKQKAQHLERKRQADEHHEDMKRHVTDTLGGSGGE